MENLSIKFCNKPFDHLETLENGQAALCCPSWLPYYTPPLSNDYSVQEAFNNEDVIKIRESILDGSFRYCNQELCPHLNSNSLPDKDSIEDKRYRQIIDNHLTENLSPIFYNLCHDKSCNLNCPSCREETFSVNSGKRYEKSLEIQQQINEEVFSEPHDRYCLINVTGSGDPFGSKIFRDFLFNVDGAKFPNVLFNLQTNGVLFDEKTWDKMSKIQKNINTVIVSVDASTEKTYNITRRGGHWGKLQKNLNFLSSLRAKKMIKELRLDFVVQQANYKEMLDFVNLGKNLKVDKVYFSKIINWGTFSTKKFEEVAVWQNDHPEYEQFLNVLKNLKLDDSIVDLGNITEYKRSEH